MAGKKQSRKHVLKWEEKSKEICCKELGLEYRSKIQRILEISGTPEGQAELETHCEPRATKFRNLFAGIGTHIPAAGIVAVVLDFLKGGLR
jgi:hypothetical protein